MSRNPTPEQVESAIDAQTICTNSATIFRTIEDPEVWCDHAGCTNEAFGSVGHEGYDGQYCRAHLLYEFDQCASCLHWFPDLSASGMRCRECL